MLKKIDNYYVFIKESPNYDKYHGSYDLCEYTDKLQNIVISMSSSNDLTEDQQQIVNKLLNINNYIIRDNG